MASINLNKEFATGYKEILSQSSEEIHLNSGNHYLLARNGRGKTTLLRTLSNLLKPKVGSFSMEGKIQFLPEDIYFNKHLTSKAVLKSLIPSQNLFKCLEFADKIELDISKIFAQLSTGNKRKLSWLIPEFSCLKGEEYILLLDEPFTGLDSLVREAFQEHWENYSEGICRLVSCHPDFDSMQIDSALLISDKKIEHRIKRGAELPWRSLKADLK